MFESVVIGSAALLLYACIRLFQKNISPILSIAVLLCYVIWYAIPAIIFLFFDYDEICTALCFRASKGDFAVAYTVEAISLSISIVLTELLCRRPIIIDSNKPDRWVSYSQAKVLIILYVAYLAWKLATQNEGYLENNSGSRYDEQASSSFIFLGGALLYAAIISIIRSLRFGSGVYWITYLLLCAEPIHSLTQGSRIAFVTPIAIILFGIYTDTQSKFSQYSNYSNVMARRLLTFSAGVLLFAITIALPISYAIENSRGDGSARVDASDTSTDSYETVKMLFTKFNSFSAAVALLDTRPEDSGIILKPYIGSALILIPRFLLKDRPVAGSIDGTIFGHPTRVVPYAEGIISDALNVGISPAYINIWSLGLIGLPIYVFISMLYLLLLNHCLNGNDFLLSTLAIWGLSIPSFIVIGSSDVILKQTVIMGALIVARYIYSFGSSLSK